MRWKALAVVLGVVLVAALVFAIVGPRDVSAPAGTEPQPADTSPEAPSGGTPLVKPRAEPAGAGQTTTAPASAPARAPERPAASPSPPSPSPAGTPPASEPGVANASAPPAAPSDAGVPFALDRDGIRAAVQEKIPELRDCYDSWLQADPSLAGRIKVSFTIDTDPNTGLGAVTQIGVMDGGIDHLALQGCVLNVFKDLSFDAPENGPITVNYPLRFSSGDGG